MDYEVVAPGSILRYSTSLLCAFTFLKPRSHYCVFSPKTHRKLRVQTSVFIAFSKRVQYQHLRMRKSRRASVNDVSAFKNLHICSYYDKMTSCVSIFSWEFKSEDHDIGFGVYFSGTTEDKYRRKEMIELVRIYTFIRIRRFSRLRSAILTG